MLIKLCVGNYATFNGFMELMTFKKIQQHIVKKSFYG